MSRAPAVAPGAAPPSRTSPHQWQQLGKIKERPPELVFRPCVLDIDDLISMSSPLDGAVRRHGVGGVPQRVDRRWRFATKRRSATASRYSGGGSRPQPSLKCFVGS